MPGRLRLMPFVSIGLVALVVAGCDVAGSSATPTASPTPTPTATPVPTVSPVVTAFRAAVAKKDFQFEVKQAGSITMKVAGNTIVVKLSGTGKYAAGDWATTSVQESLGKKSTIDEVQAGKYKYMRANGAKWTRTARPTGTAAKSQFAPFFMADLPLRDLGAQTARDGSVYHKLVVADGTTLDPASVGMSTAGMTDVKMSVALWAKDNGTPVGISYEVTWKATVNGAAADVAMSWDLMFTKTSGVKVTAPKM